MKDKSALGLQFVQDYIAQNVKGKLRTTTGGVLNRDDFILVQKIMEIYAKVLLYNTRIKHQEERAAFLENKNP